MPYSSVVQPIDIPKCNLLSYLYPKDRKKSDKPLWLESRNPQNSLSAEQALLWVKRFAVGLDILHIESGKTIMVFTPNHIFVPVIYMGTAGSGRCFTGANPVYTVNEVAHQMKLIEAAAVFIHPSLLETGLKAAAQAKIPKDKIFQFADRALPIRNGIRDWREMLASEAEAENWQWDPLEGDAALNTVAAINFSSGTTGLPKGVCISHRNLISNVSQVIHMYAEVDGIPRDKKERWVAMLPFYHAYSQLWTINIALKIQAEVYVMSNFVFEEFLRCIAQYRVTTLQTVPPVLVMLAKRPETKKYDLSSLKHVVCGAAPLSSELQNEIATRYDILVQQAWGMSETTCGGIMFRGKESDLTGSIGYLLPNSEAKLIDEEGHEVTTEGEPGELWIRGPQMMMAYWRNPEATNDSYDADRWFKTGDVAVTKKGLWWIVDRKKELIKVNGLQVAPAELEAVLLEHDDIADTAVTGIMLHGEEAPIAYVVLQDAARDKITEEIVQNFVKGKVAKHKQLKGGVKFVEAIPKLSSGKVVRKALREWAKRDQKEMEGKVRARL